MWPLMAGLLLAVVVELAAAPLRERVSLIRAGERMVLCNQQASAHLDATILFITILALGYAVILDSLIAVAATLVAVGVVVWCFVSVRRAPAFLFDRAENEVWRGAHRVCSLSAVNQLAVVAGEQTARLELRYRSPDGHLHRELLCRAWPQQA